MSYELKNHQEWLGYVQPVGLVVSAPAMLAAECQINRNMGPIHQRFMSALPVDESEDPVPVLPEFKTFAQNVLGWRESDLVQFLVDDVPEELQPLEIVLETYNETLRPTYVVPEYKPVEGESPWVMLIQELPSDVDLDANPEAIGRNWHASPHLKFERLLRETKVPFGIITNGKLIRLVYAPKGETSGYITFQVDQMATVAGRPIFAALHMLLEDERVFGMEKSKRLPAILANSRKYQNIVSTKLAEQVMSALFELLRGFQSADDQRDGILLKEILANDPQHIYHGLLNVLMRMVFVLYAEDRGLISTDEVYTNHYSIAGLFERLRSDAGRFPDTMDQRYGAWAQLLTLFRLIHDGGSHGEFEIPARDGYLFDPHRYPFLEGRYDNYDVKIYSEKEKASPIQVPRVSDGTLYRVLEDLLVLDGERLSYRTLDVEQIGSVYEAIMGFELEVAQGRSIAIKPVKRHGAPSTINLEALLESKPANRAKLVKEWSDQKITGAAIKELKEADSIEGILNALDKKIAKAVTPNIVPKGAMVFQPSDERRRSGSHYTPRSLTEPIVETTLQPILQQLVQLPERVEESSRKPSEESTKPATPALIAAEEPAVYRIADRDRPISAPVQPRPIPKDLRKRLTQGEVAARERLEQQRADNHTAAIRKGVPHPSQILDLKICDPAMGSGAFLVETCRQLGDKLVESWHAHSTAGNLETGATENSNHYPLTTNNYPPDIPPDEDEVLYARRLIAQRCLYGVDKNVMAVDLAKLSLWLVTLAKDHAFTFLDHALRHGDSLVGLTREQIIGFHWEVKKQKKFGEDLIQRRLDRATEARAKILNAREDVPYRDQAARMGLANDALDLIRLLGDACVSAFFAGQKKKEREEEVERIYGLANSYLGSIPSRRANSNDVIADSADAVSENLSATNYQLSAKGTGVDFASRQALQAAADRLHEQPHPVPAFHWEIEFPEVFARENGGFDAFVGNPPFLGKNTLSNSSREGYGDWLKVIHDESHGNADLVAHFYRRTFDQLRKSGGTLGLIATNTIAQGDTRSTGLRWICTHGGHIYSARRCVKWPGLAAVIVSVVHIIKGVEPANRTIDGRQVDFISAYLFHAGGHDDPFPQKANQNRCFQGPIPLGMGFTFDDTDSSGLATSLSEMKTLIDKDPRNKERIFPYLGGQEMLNHPSQSHDRFVIHFDEMSEEEARRWPDLMKIVEEKVKPERDKNKRATRAKYWWRFGENASALFTTKQDLDYVMMHPFTTSNVCFARVPASTIISGPHNVFTIDDFGSFAVLQSRCHEIWARFFASSFKDDLRYTPSDCFDTFPFPQPNNDLEQAGRDYYQFRADRMIASDEGLTKTFNRFHDPHEQSEGILELRRLHGLMDGAVLRAYGWDDLAESARCEFLLDYEEEEDDESPATGKRSRKKKPWRYRWPDEFRDEVLARLLELNEQRHKEELLAGQVGETTKKKKTKSTSKRTKKRNSSSHAELF